MGAGALLFDIMSHLSATHKTDLTGVECNAQAHQLPQGKSGHIQQDTATMQATISHSRATYDGAAPLGQCSDTGICNNSGNI